MNNYVSIPNSIILSSQKMSSTQSKLFYLAIDRFNKDAFSLDEEQLRAKKYRISFKEFIPNFTKNRGKTNYEFAANQVDKIVQQIMKITEEDSIASMNIISSIKVIREAAAVEIIFSFNIIPLLLEMTKTGYTKILFSDIFEMKSKYSRRIFELIEKNKTLWSTKKKGGFSIKIQELRFLLGIENGKYKRFNNLRERVLLPAQKEILEKTSVTFQIECKKDGRFVTEVSFKNIKTTKPKVKKELLQKPTEQKMNGRLLHLHEKSRDYYNRNHTKEFIEYYYELARNHERKGLITTNFSNCFYSFLKNDEHNFYKKHSAKSIAENDPAANELLNCKNEFDDLPEITKEKIRRDLEKCKNDGSVSTFCSDWLHFTTIQDAGKITIIDGHIQEELDF